jgi:alkyl sulfatase BDS1-like metallo-beta-lactamase superfamily hydrolase
MMTGDAVLLKRRAAGALTKVLFGFIVLIVLAGQAGCAQPKKELPAQLAATEALDVINKHCAEQIGQPRIEKVSEHVWAALGYELASTILIHTGEGNVIVDTSIVPAAAQAVKRDLLKAAPSGPVKAIIYTHSHVDHTMGTTVWAENGTRIWATDSFVAHWFKQYGLFGQAEATRGMRQQAYHTSRDEVPCSAVGPIMRTYSLDDTGVVGPLIPTDTFSGVKQLEIGGLEIVLYSAPGETHDQLIVWIPADKTLLCADDYYWAFPNLYTIRGTSPRPVDEWITSIDTMRRLQPEHLVPSHTAPINGSEKIAGVLTNYRDAIQYVRNEVVRRANRGEDIDTIAESVKLPEQLARQPYMWEGYGQVDWSARAIYTNNLGWFDGRADKLYPLDHAEAAKREIELMGGPGKVLEQANKALESGDSRWAVHLLAKLKDSGLAAEDIPGKVNEMLAQGLRQVAAGTFNTNGRAYLLEYATELTEGPFKQTRAALPVETVASMPVGFLFDNIAVRLDPAKAQGVLESVRFIFPDLNTQFTVTVRNGIAEVVEGEPLPGTPAPLSTVTVDSLTYKMMALKMLDIMAAFTQGKIKVEGSLPGFIAFMGRF